MHRGALRTLAVFFCLLTGVARAQPITKDKPLTLDQIIERVRQSDLRVQEADAQLRVYRGKYSEARWAWVPRIESTILVAGPTPEARNDGLGGPPTTKST